MPRFYHVYDPFSDRKRRRFDRPGSNKKKSVICIERWIGKMFRNGQKTRKKWSWEKRVTTLRSSSWCSSVNICNMLYIIEKYVKSSCSWPYFREKIKLISESKFTVAPSFRQIFLFWSFLIRLQQSEHDYSIRRWFYSANKEVGTILITGN
jgi:hypothetical protein